MEGTQTPVMVAQRVGSKQTKKRAVPSNTTTTEGTGTTSNTTTTEGTGTTTRRVGPYRKTKADANINITKQAQLKQI